MDLGIRTDAALLERAWALPVARRYRAVFRHQQGPATCGAASLANVFRSRGDDIDEPGVLHGSGQAWHDRGGRGLTLDQLADVGRRRSLVRVVRPRSVEDLRRHLRRTNDPTRRYLVNFHRGPLFGAGGGHHSPIAGYLEDQDLAFVLDVNRRFPPFLVSAPRLLEAASGVDEAGGNARGLLRL